MSSSEKIDDIINYYSQNRESERHQTQQLEFAIMSRVLKSLLSQKQLRVLELGAGSGYYTKLLADMGHQVVAVEPVKELIEQNQNFCKKSHLDDRVEWIHSDARDLNGKIQGEFDVILNMGPLYHLIAGSDRKTLLQQSKTFLKEQGLMMSVMLSRIGYLSYILAKQPESLVQDPEGFRDIMTQGFDPNHPRNGTFRGYFTDLNEVAKLHQEVGLQIQKLHVLDPIIGGLDSTFNQLANDLKEVWAEILFAFSSDSAFWNTGRTWLIISSKN